MWGTNFWFQAADYRYLWNLLAKQDTACHQNRNTIHKDKEFWDSDAHVGASTHGAAKDEPLLCRRSCMHPFYCMNSSTIAEVKSFQKRCPTSEDPLMSTNRALALSGVLWKHLSGRPAAVASESAVCVLCSPGCRMSTTIPWKPRLIRVHPFLEDLGVSSC